MSEITQLHLNDIALNSHATYQFNNSTVFYSLVNPVFIDYYQRIVRKSQQWLDGYDPEFHRNDMFSSRIAEKIINGLATSILGKGLLFKEGKNNTDKEHKTLNYIGKKWAIDVNLEQSVKNLIGYTLGIGTGCLKVNMSSNGELWVEAQRLDYFYYAVDGRKKVISYTGFVRAFQSVEHQDENYFLVEKRYFKKVDKTFENKIQDKTYIFKEGTVEIPVVEYSVHMYRGMIQNNTMPSASSAPGINYKSLPEDVKRVLRKEYGFIKCDEPMPLPFVDWLGVELFYNEGGDITNPTLPFGRSLTFSNLTDFMEYDMAKSYSIRDLYNSKGIVGVPRSLSQQDLAAVVSSGANPSQGELHAIRDSAFGHLNIPGFEVIPGMNPDTQKPIITQFEIRAAEHETKQNAIIRSIALNIGVSPKILAAYLVSGSQQTDDQVQSEDNSIAQWVKTHRKDYINGLNRVIANIAHYYGYVEPVMISFASDDLLKEDVLLQLIEKKMELGLMDVEDAIRELYPDLDEDQLQLKIDKAKFMQQQKSMEMTDLDPFALQDEE